MSVNRKWTVHINLQQLIYPNSSADSSSRVYVVIWLFRFVFRTLNFRKKCLSYFDKEVVVSIPFHKKAVNLVWKQMTYHWKGLEENLKKCAVH